MYIDQAPYDDAMNAHAGLSLILASIAALILASLLLYRVATRWLRKRRAR